METEGQRRMLAARALALRVQEPELKKTLIEGIDAAIESAASARFHAEARKLLSHWQTMPEHLTGARAIRELQTIVDGGYAPTSHAGAFRPKQGG